MVHIITNEVIRKNTEIRCDLTEREFVQRELKKTKYVQTSLLEGEGDYMIGSKSTSEYRGSFIAVVSESVDRHDKLVALIENYLIQSMGRSVKAETHVDKGNGVKVY